MVSFVNVRALTEKEKYLVDSNQNELALLEKSFPSHSEGVGPALLGDSIITPPSTCVLRHFSRVQLFVTLWTIAHQAPLSMGFSRQ